MNKKLTTVYAIGCTIVLAQIVSTVYNSSLAVFHGQKVAELTAQKKQLVVQKNQLKKQLATSTALTEVAALMKTEDYTQLHTNFVVNTTSTAVALR